MAVGFFVQAVPALELTPKLIALANAVFPGEGTNLDVGTTVGVPLQVHGVAPAQMSEHPNAKAFLTTFEKHPTLLATSGSVRLTHQSGVHISYSTSDGLLGKFEMTLQDPERARRALDALSDHFKVIEYADFIRSRMDEGEQAALQMRERSVADLSDQVEKLAKYLGELGLREAESRRKIQGELENEYRAREAKLEESARLRDEASDKRQVERDEALAKRVGEHEEREKKFTTHEAKYMRRELLERIDKVIDAMGTFTVSKSTESKRMIIHLVTWLLVLTSAGVGGSMLVTFLSSSPLELRLLFPLAAASATLVTTFVYYLKWNDRWFREHADHEFAAKQYQADILRASWVAELVSEWQTEKREGELPPELLGAFTKHLFRGAGATRENEHPIEAVTGLVKRVTSVTVGKGSISVRGDTGEDAPRAKPRAKRIRAEESAPEEDEGGADHEKKG